MGTSIELKIGGLSLDYAKNNMGNNYGFLFQESDRTCRQTDEIDYEYADENYTDDELRRTEACFVRPLRNVLPRLNLLGHTIETARDEYEAVIKQAQQYRSYGIENQDCEPSKFMNFEEFCKFCGKFDITQLDSSYNGSLEKTADYIKNSPFADAMEEINQIPDIGHRFGCRSDKSFFGSSVCILSAHSMIQVFGYTETNLDLEVIRQFGPIVEAGWVEEDLFRGGAGRRHTILVATEGTSDARILRRAIDTLHPDVSDFFSFIDVDQSHPFPGTGNLVRFAEGLVHINIQNRILFVLDNDAEGFAAFHKIEKMPRPANMRVMILPSLRCFEEFLTRGPEGVNRSDINRRAASIECYLDLELPNRPQAEIVWSNYKKEIDLWHGALEYKETYTRYFLEQSCDDIRNGSYDAFKIKFVLIELINESIRLAVADVGAQE